jgi:[ribosomal protein S5]-alanine N-acetyltransferase
MSNSSASIALHGPTLTLRLPVPDDAAALLELAGDPEVTRWFSWGPYTDIDQPRAYIARLPDQRARGEQLDLLIVHHEDGPIGVIGLSELVRRDRRAVVGTWLGRRWWGSGANFEAKALVARLAFDALGLERLGAYADVQNDRSQAALRRIGFAREGVLRGFHRHGERVRDVAVFGLLRADWERSPLAEVPVAIEGTPPRACVVTSVAAPS